MQAHGHVESVLAVGELNDGLLGGWLTVVGDRLSEPGVRRGTPPHLVVEATIDLRRHRAYAPGDDMFTISWPARENRSYGLYYGPDLVDFGSDVSDNIDPVTVTDPPPAIPQTYDAKTGVLTYGPFPNPLTDGKGVRPKTILFHVLENEP